VSLQVTNSSGSSSDPAYTISITTGARGRVTKGQFHDLADNVENVITMGVWQGVAMDSLNYR
jgi:hypothetical protein